MDRERCPTADIMDNVYPTAIQLRARKMIFTSGRGPEGSRDDVDCRSHVGRRGEVVRGGCRIRGDSLRGGTYNRRDRRGRKFKRCTDDEDGYD